MKRVLRCGLCSCVALLMIVQQLEISAQTPSPEPADPNAKTTQVRLQKGQQVDLQLLESVSSATARNGQLVQLATASDVVENDIVAIPKGTPAVGVIKHLSKALPGKKNGYLEIEASQLTLPNGTTVKLGEYPPGDDACGDMGPCWALFIIAAPFTPLILLQRLNRSTGSATVKSEG